MTELLMSMIANIVEAIRAFVPMALAVLDMNQDLEKGKRNEINIYSR